MQEEVITFFASQLTNLMAVWFSLVFLNIMFATHSVLDRQRKRMDFHESMSVYNILSFRAVSLGYKICMAYCPLYYNI
jgi:hypothetical protein